MTGSIMSSDTKYADANAKVSKLILLIKLLWNRCKFHIISNNFPNSSEYPRIYYPLIWIENPKIDETQVSVRLKRSRKADKSKALVSIFEPKIVL